MNTVSRYTRVLGRMAAALAAAVLLTTASAYARWPQLVGQLIGLYAWPLSQSGRLAVNNRVSSWWEQPCGYFGSQGCSRGPFSINCYTTTLNRLTYFGVIPQSSRSQLQEEDEWQLARYPSGINLNARARLVQHIAAAMDRTPEGAMRESRLLYVEAGWPLPCFFYLRIDPPDPALPHIWIVEEEGHARDDAWSARFPMRPLWGGLTLNLVFYAALVYLPLCAVERVMRELLFRLRSTVHRLRERRAGARLCLRCGYPVPTRALSCPECGAVYGAVGEMR